MTAMKTANVRNPYLEDFLAPVTAEVTATDLRVTDAILDTGEKVNIEAKLLDPKDKLSSYAGLYTDQFLH